MRSKAVTVARALLGLVFFVVRSERVFGLVPTADDEGRRRGVHGWARLGATRTTFCPASVSKSLRLARNDDRDLSTATQEAFPHGGEPTPADSSLPSIST